jgi:hypothetical protein
MAGEQLDRQLASVGVGQEADARRAIAFVAEGGEGVLLAFQISAGEPNRRHRGALDQPQPALVGRRHYPGQVALCLSASRNAPLPAIKS